MSTSSRSHTAARQERQITNAHGTASDSETTPLLNGSSKPPERPSLWQRTHRHFTANVDNTWGDVALLFCYIITGLLDSSSTSIWGSFVSMQTGNTVYVGLGLAHPSDSDRWIRSGISILSYCAGSFFFSRFHRALGVTRRWVIVASYTIQLLLCAIAALIVTLNPNVSDENSGIDAFVATPLAILAFQSSGQTVVSRVLKYPSLTSVVLTSIYCDLFSDRELFTASLTQNAERNRRAIAPLLLLVGAIFGGLWAHSSFGMAGALWTAVILKTLVVTTWIFWKAEPQLQEP
ncbi:hypothetical protein K431DRAFT_160604 [Polychaeton citri CBS 116435]|uniref:DUF1275 domain protein n=1 Tax=Polychaeton citri CBS 116435 TaxID=1314669 RepID=A0A9P4Q0Q6_9PEZI|nr:hypothetical protein K431DRAFT_160604 [Polychaeton citri CBS 116435]